ncbi:MAG: double-strand break repair helicase AddA, partial [Hyphomicrobiales bacterium]
KRTDVQNIDLMNLGDAILLPQDDLALAVALKSPIFGLTEEQLFTLAYNRRNKSLRQSLAEHARSDAAFANALKRLVACETRAMNTTPFAFYSWLLGGDGGRQRIFQRLNHEPGDALDEFLQLALNYEQREPASLQGFMTWLRAADIEIKRDMELSRDEVRVMTVHGSKGLEAPVVFLMDTTSSPTDNQRLSLIPLTPGGCVVWGGRQSDDPPVVTEARARMKTETENEYRRLLYVAMTRAAERLVIGGTMPGNRKEVGEQWWYHLIRQGLETSELTETVIDTPDGAVRRFARPDDLISLPVSVSTPAAPPAATPLPAWLRQTNSAVASAFDLRRPSDAGDHDGAKLKRGEADDIRRKALQRGTLTHRLLQSLPDIPAERRTEAAAQYLVRNTDKTWEQSEREALASQVLALMADTRFAELFAAGSRAEVSIAGKLDRPGRSPLMVSGQIDRLVVSDSEVLIADYKTNHTPPREAVHAPQAYVQQLALYRAVLAKLYPGRPVRGVLVWTEGPEIMEISAAALDHEMTQIISA